MAHDINARSLQRLRHHHEEIQKIGHTLMEAAGLDPQTHALDIENGRIVPLEEDSDQTQEDA